MKLAKHVFVTDTSAEKLVNLFRKNPNIITIWKKTSKKKNKEPVLKSAICFEAKSNIEALYFSKNFVNTISPFKSHDKYSILKGITKDQIKQLITYTKSDPEIKKFTRDKERFKNVRSFTAWKSRHKTIYVLVNRKGRLLGIIWFARQKYQKYPYTVAIRIYKSARGKKLSLKFMQHAYNDFRINHKKLKVWLRTDGKNIRAIKLYKKFGFKKFTKEMLSGDLIMVVA